MKGLIRIARASVAATAVEIVQVKYNLELGINQIAIVKRVDFSLGLSANSHSVRAGIYRKSDTTIANAQTGSAAVVEDKNWLTWGFHDSGDAAFTGRLFDTFQEEFPDKTVLIREPLLVLRNLQAITASLISTIYYVQEDVSKKEMAQLMMIYKGK